MFPSVAVGFNRVRPPFPPPLPFARVCAINARARANKSLSVFSFGLYQRASRAAESEHVLNTKKETATV